MILNEPINPYAAPQSLPAIRLHESNQRPSISSARRRLRFANYLIDQLAIALLAFVIWFISVFAADDFGYTGGLAFMQSVPPLLLSLLLTLAYYLLLEATTSRTVGKLITGTVVVNGDGSKPSFGQIAGRTFARMIPFEAFSFFSQARIGWHDLLSKTFVVKGADARVMRSASTVR